MKHPLYTLLLSWEAMQDSNCYGAGFRKWSKWCSYLNSPHSNVLQLTKWYKTIHYGQENPAYIVPNLIGSLICSTGVTVTSIVQNVDSTSLIIVDELGRGTSSEEGVGICHAICEHLLATKVWKSGVMKHGIELAYFFLLPSLPPSLPPSLLPRSRPSHYLPPTSWSLLIWRHSTPMWKSRYNNSSWQAY